VARRDIDWAAVFHLIDTTPASDFDISLRTRASMEQVAWARTADREARNEQKDRFMIQRDGRTIETRDSIVAASRLFDRHSTPTSSGRPPRRGRYQVIDRAMPPTDPARIVRDKVIS
jgi:hypothetical protein